MGKSETQLFKLGIFVLLGLTLIALGTYFIGTQQSMFGKTEKIIAVFKEVNGLKTGNNVRLSGLNVGTVKSVTMKDDSTIYVDILINKDIFPFIYKDATASIGTDGLVGNMVLSITAGKKLNEKISPLDTIFSLDKIGTDKLLKTLNRTNENAAAISDNLLQITEDMSNGKGTIGMLLNDKSLAEDLKYSVKQLNTIMRSTSATISNINKMVASIDNDHGLIALLKDSTVVEEIRSTIGNIQNSSARMDTTFVNLNNFVVKSKNGKGIYNYILHDTSLVNTVQHATTNLDSTIIQLNKSSLLLNENLEALKHNFLFRSYFKKLEKEKLKKKS